MNPALSVVIVNFNAGAHLRRCLESLVEHLSSTEWDAVVVDNRSSDGSEQIVAEFEPRIALLRNPTNVGFGRAVNQGVMATTGPLCLFLNPDGMLLPGAVSRLRDAIKRQTDCGVVAPAVVNDDGTPQGNARGDPTMLTGLFGRTSLLRRFFPHAAVARRNVVIDAEPRTGEVGVHVDWVSGSCMLVRRDIFGLVGGFDERFFMYWEDADLCRRVRAAGFTIRYLPEARVAHSVGRSSHSAPALAIRAFHRSAYLYYRRYVASSVWEAAMAFGLLRLRCQWHLWQQGRPRRSGMLEERDDVTIP